MQFACKNLQAVTLLTVMMPLNVPLIIFKVRCPHCNNVQITFSTDSGQMFGYLFKKGGDFLESGVIGSMNQRWGTAAAVTHEYRTKNVNMLKRTKAGKQHSPY